MPDMRLRVELEAVSNLRLETNYIPGSTLRGALAACWIRDHGLPPRLGDEDLQEFLLLFERDVRYGFCLPEGTNFEPLSLMRCKYSPKDDCEKSFNDAAADGYIDNSDAEEKRCEFCEGPLTFSKGELVGSAKSLQVRHRVSLTASETAEEGKLYAVKRIPQGTKLHGQIETSSELACEWLVGEKRKRLFVGASKSVDGLVKAKIKAAPTSAVEDVRLRDDGHLCLHLESPAIFVDDATCPILDPNKINWIRQLRLDAEPGMPTDFKINCLRPWTRLSEIKGWHAASDLPKPLDFGFSAGSVFLLKIEPELSEEKLRELAVRIASSAYGCRTTEGFGAVSVNAVSVNPPASASIDEPVDAVSVNRQASASIDELVDTLQEMTPDDLSWLVDRLKECARAVANGNVPGRITEMKRSKEFTQGQREAIDAGSALKLDEVEKLINLLDSERQP